MFLIYIRREGAACSIRSCPVLIDSNPQLWSMIWGKPSGEFSVICASCLNLA